jgi:N4-gp56 family major capsid protein
MSYSGMQYGDVSPRVGLYAVANFLVHAQPSLILERFAMTQAVPKNVSMTIKWRRPIPFAVSTEQLVEGVTPAPMGIEYEDVTGVLSQYGSWIGFTDVLQDTHEDDNLKTMTMLAGEQAALTKERILWNMMIGGTNVVYSGTASSRATVIAPLALKDLRIIQRTLKVAMAKPLTRMIDASDKIATQPVAGGYVGVGHTNFEQDLRGLSGFVPREQYSSTTKLLNEFEIGKVEDLRIILAPHFTYYVAGGGTIGSGVLRTGGKADVYPMVFFGQDAFAATPLKGMDSARVVVKNPQMGSSYEDPLGQRGFVAWKMWYSATRLNEAWIVRLEAAITAL